MAYAEERARTQILTDRREVERCASTWGDLSGSSSPVGGGAWIRSWLATYGQDYGLHVVVAGNPESPDAMLPLVRRRGQPWFAETLGVRELFEATDVYGHDQAALRAIAETLAARGLPLRLRRLRDDSALLPHLREVYAGRAKLVTRPVPGIPTITLDDSWREPTTHFSRRRQQDFRAARRRLEALGSVELSIEQPATAEEADRLLEEFVAVEAASWKSRAGSALDSVPQMHEFFRSFCRLATEAGELRFAMLRLDGRAVAGQLATENDGRFSLFKIGYDETYARCSPGNLLMLHAVQRAAERGLESFEFLGSEEPWTQLWTSSVRECVEVHVYPARPWTPVAVGAIGMQLAAREVRRRRESSAETEPVAEGDQGDRVTTSRAGRVLKSTVRPLMGRAGTALLFGETRAEALALASRLDASGIAATLAYWDGPDDTPETIEAELHGCITELGRLSTPARMSIKVPPLGFSAPAVRRLATTAHDAGVGLVLDAHAPEGADQTLALARHAVELGAATGVAIPARWARSAEDARAALDDGVHVRIVKGQWPDPAHPHPPGSERELRAAFAELSRSLESERARVNVATHDAPLIDTLLGGVTQDRPFDELELLMGLPASGPLRRARQHAVPVRWYIPYGHASLGFDPRELVRRPRLASTLGRAIIRGRGNRAARERELRTLSQDRRA